jgi:hypothetical protein
MNTETMTNTVKKIKYEIKTCGRCGGSGRHSYCSVHADVCFGCNGKGHVLTSAGVKASQAVDKLVKELCSVTPEEALGKRIYNRFLSAVKQGATVQTVERRENSVVLGFRGVNVVINPTDKVVVVPTLEQFAKIAETLRATVKKGWIFIY